MLTRYILMAMQLAVYEQMEDGRIYGEIPALRGVYADGATLEECREEMQSALEDWIVFGLVNGFPLPSIDGIELAAAKVASS